MTDEETPIDALRDVIAWSADKPVWQRDTLRRLCQNRSLTDADRAELLLICKQAHGINDPEHAAPTSRPATEAHIPTGDAGSQAVALRCIRDVQNVNALARSQKIKFQQDGLTIIYGHNGSGKSGYARILARACRSRAAGDILPNVYEAQPTDPARASIEFALGPATRTVAWVDGTESDPALSAVSFFDSACANVHVAEPTTLAYTPTPLTILGDLATACRGLREVLQAERNTVAASTPERLGGPQCHSHTAVGHLCAQISATSRLEDFEALAALSDEEQLRLQVLSRDLADDPSRRASQLEDACRRLGALITAVEQFHVQASDEAVERYRVMLRDAETKREAARVAANGLFSDSPLPHIGSDAWQRLWAAARRYSDDAYPGQSFPVTSEGARCPLCQQTLEQEARRRFVSFERYVQDNLQQAATAAEDAVEQHRQTLRGNAITREWTSERVAFVSGTVENPDLASQLRAYLVVGRRRVRTLVRVHRAADVPTFPSLADGLFTSLHQQGQGLQHRIAALRKASQSEERQKLLRELQELEDRRWLSTVLQDIDDEIKRKIALAAFDACMADTDTTAITRKASAVSDALVTARLRHQFSAELAHLGVDNVFVELVRHTGAYGASRFQVKFLRTAAAPVDRVLSEGEHRCIALAAFLAELATAPVPSGVVFDDPVSSLDHRYRDAFAVRLAEEAHNRQVIVFTHDLVFAFALARCAKRRGVTTAYRHVCRTNYGVGICDSDPPLDYRPVDDAIRHLRSRLDSVRNLYENNRVGEWHDQAKGLLGRIRETWERAVEAALSPVVERFSHDVKTKNLLRITVVRPEDCSAVDGARARCSQLQHSMSAAAQAPPVAPDVVGTEIDRLEEWLRDVQRRQEAVRVVEETSMNADAND